MTPGSATARDWEAHASPHIADAFCDADFLGNPAGVVLLQDGFPAKSQMQAAAARWALPTTAFVSSGCDGGFSIRWFTPREELNLCGHATIAAAGVLAREGRVARGRSIVFETGFGPLLATVRTRPGEAGADRVTLDLPALDVSPCAPPDGLAEALGVDAPQCVGSVDDLIVLLPDAETVRALNPDFRALEPMAYRGHVVTAPGDGAGAHFVSRSFFPAMGVDEDQVCVSAHCKLAPYWAGRLGRASMTALQLSRRGGRLELDVEGARVRVTGAVMVRGASAGAAVA